jgi:hypothetical protein
MNDQPYAYQIWICSACGNEAVEVGGVLVCETSDDRFSPSPSGRAELVPDDEDD